MTDRRVVTREEAAAIRYPAPRGIAHLNVVCKDPVVMRARAAFGLPTPCFRCLAFTPTPGGSPHQGRCHFVVRAMVDTTT